MRIGIDSKALDADAIKAAFDNCSGEEIHSWLLTLKDKGIRVIVPHQADGVVTFEPIGANLDYLFDFHASEVMSAPRKFIYPAHDNLFAFHETDNLEVLEIVPEPKQTFIFGVRACDMAAIHLLDKIFLSDPIDRNYSTRRQVTTIAVTECRSAGPACFCSSMGSGPMPAQDFLPDIFISPVDNGWGIKALSSKGIVACGLTAMESSEPADVIGSTRELSFSRHLETKGLPLLLKASGEHRIFRDLAESKCLGCTNCTMVCPTCFCFNYFDLTGIGSNKTLRRRQWDSCQDLHFTDVSHGNFRESRRARLRQFVSHKFSSWVFQYGTFGCVGCGRCLSWCPTQVDIIKIVEAIQSEPVQP